MSQQFIPRGALDPDVVNGILAKAAAWYTTPPEIPMPRTVQHVPESITKDAYLALVAGAGFDPKHIRSLEFKPEGIYAEVWETGEQGQHVLDGSDGPAFNRVFIPIKD